LQGITNFVNALSDPGRFGAKFTQQLTASIVPNIIAQPTAMYDPVVREINSIFDAIQARIPGARQELMPKRDWLGEAIPSKERVAVIAPIRVQGVSEDKVRLEAARLDISMALAPKKVHIGKGTGKLGDVELTPEERNKFAEIGGNMAHQILTEAVNDPRWNATPDIVKKRVFSKILMSAHKVAAAQTLTGEKRQALIGQITERMQTELQPEEVQ